MGRRWWHVRSKYLVLSFLHARFVTNPMASHNFFTELKRRNVYKIAVAYLVIAWLVIQAASIFLPAFDAPQWAMQIVIFILVVGFPIALVFSWAFEITPEGIVRESAVDAEKSITHHTGRR